ncbi:hypothetical protein E2C01_018913 [Portunus trituberculatus]|uniref:Uncharacterized protein n=1 Tax=Portunus trituberculatus TaxID=210409 RepID=A0A5B7DWA9_PORTR|nr:hypothetical protein [Portunus trituberculatus]
MDWWPAAATRGLVVGGIGRQASGAGVGPPPRPTCNLVPTTYLPTHPSPNALAMDQVGRAVRRALPGGWSCLRSVLDQTRAIPVRPRLRCMSHVLAKPSVTDVVPPSATSAACRHLFTSRVSCSCSCSLYGVIFSGRAGQSATAYPTRGIVPIIRQVTWSFDPCSVPRRVLQQGVIPPSGMSCVNRSGGCYVAPSAGGVNCWRASGVTTATKKRYHCPTAASQPPVGCMKGGETDKSEALCMSLYFFSL